MSRWFRYYDDALNDPKVQLLPNKPVNYFKCWVNLLSIASKNNGSLVSIDVVSYALRMAPDRAAAVVTFLTKRGLLDQAQGGYFEPHNWKARQFQSDLSTSRVQQYRERKKQQEGNVTGNVSSEVSETPPEQSTEQSTEQTDSSLRSDSSVLSLTTLSDSNIKNRELVECARVQKPCQFQAEFDQWYANYPHKIGKQDAIKAFVKVRKSGVELHRLTDGLARYAAKTDDRPWCNPATFLNQGRYDDQPAAFNGHGHAPRPGSREDRQEQTNDAVRQLTEFIEVRGNDGRPSGASRQADDGMLPLAKPA